VETHDFLNEYLRLQPQMSDVGRQTIEASMGGLLNSATAQPFDYDALHTHLDRVFTNHAISQDDQDNIRNLDASLSQPYLRLSDAIAAHAAYNNLSQPVRDVLHDIDGFNGAWQQMARPLDLTQGALHLTTPAGVTEAFKVINAQIVRGPQFDDKEKYGREQMVNLIVGLLNPARDLRRCRADRHDLWQC